MKTPYRGIGRLPRFLVQRLGADVVKRAIAQGTETQSDNPVLPEPRLSCHCQATGFCTGATVSKTASRRKWKRIQEGTLEPDKLYFLDEALKIAGLM